MRHALLFVDERSPDPYVAGSLLWHYRGVKATVSGSWCPRRKENQ